MCVWYGIVQRSAYGDGVEPREESDASVVAVTRVVFGPPRAARFTAYQVMSAKGERANPGVGSGASSSNMHS